MSSRIPRLGFDELPPSIAAALSAKVQRLGYLGEFFACAAHQEAALKGFIDFSEAARNALDPRLAEIVALTVAELMDVAYERHQHERLAVALGFSEDWVRAVQALRSEESRLTTDERRVQRYVITAIRNDGHGAGDAWTTSWRVLVMSVQWR